MSPTAPTTATTTPITTLRAITATPLDARYPIALLPLRLETRFDGDALKVRIFPDEIFADTHEPGLTADEQRDGAAYVATLTTPSEPAQWATLVARYGEPRAAWVALASAKGSATTRAESWTRAAQALLPDNWIVRAYRGGRQFTISGASIAQPLALTVSPNPGAQIAISDGLTLDAAVEWTVHYDAAVAAGMAVTIDLTKPDGAATAIVRLPLPTGPIDVYVVGVKNQAPTDGAAQLHALFDAQHYTRGLAFVAPGTPTSNTADASAGYPTKDPGAAHSFSFERQAPLVVPEDGSDGDRFARALGLAANADEKSPVVDHLDGAARHQESMAAAMNGALWPATLGYFMQQMMAPKFDAATIDAARSYVIGNLRPGGPLPAFRVGRVPYGLLPVVSLTDYAPDTTLSHALRVLRDAHFLPAATKMPRVTPGSTDPDGDLLRALAVDASCRQMRIRVLLGQDVTKNTAGIFGLPSVTLLEALQAARADAAQTLLASFGLGAATRLGTLDPGAAKNLLNAPLVTRAPLSETTGVDYIQTLIGWASSRPIDFASIRDDKLPGTDRPLLYRVLRHALLLEMDRVGITAATASLGPGASAPGAPTALMAERIATPVELVEPELINLGAAATSTGYGRIGLAIGNPRFAPALGPYLAFLRTLASLPSAELERRFGEALDACSHRLEAWITSLANARLWDLRAKYPTGIYCGGFGWVENLSPATAPASGDFIHAPSQAQASAAAILRNGYDSRGGGGSPYAVQLGAARVRDALDLVDGTRQGEPLAALLGCRFERELHARSLDKLIAPLRSKFPLVAGRTPEGGGPVEMVAATNVVDGLALRAAKPPAPIALTATETTGYQAALAILDGAVDGVADLLTAESVFQAVRGNPTAAVAALDAMAQGVLPPEVDVVRTPSAGAPFTQRLAVVLDGAALAPAGTTPRAAAEPALDAWATQLLGDWTQVGCRVTAADGGTKSVTLDQLRLCPLDWLALAKTPPTGNGDGEIDRRVLDVAGVAGTIRYDVADTAHSFAELLELGRALGALIGGARALSAADLVSPADAGSAPVSDATAQAAVTRARAALTTAAGVASALTAALAPVAAKLAASPPAAATAAESTALRAALQTTSLYGIAGAYPAARASAADLATAGAAVAAELAARQAGAPALTASDAQSLLAAATGTMAALFGRDFRFLPAFTPAAPTALVAALAEAPSLVPDANLPRQVVQQVARVRQPVARWRSLFLYCEALGTQSASLDVAQLPTQQTTWAAAKGAAPASGTVSLLLHRPAATAPTQSWAGLLVDEWTEIIPAATQSTALAFHHPTPVAEAPQAVLLAVSPPNATTWTEDLLFNTLRDALALAKTRLVDTVDDLRPFLPAICLTGNTANETVSTSFLSSLVAEPIIVRSAT